MLAYDLEILLDKVCEHIFECFDLKIKAVFGEIQNWISMINLLKKSAIIPFS